MKTLRKIALAFFMVLATSCSLLGGAHDAIMIQQMLAIIGNTIQNQVNLKKQIIMHTL